MYRLIACLVAVIVSTTTIAAEKVYKYTDENGNTVFTDAPTKGAEEMIVEPVATVPAIPVSRTPANSQDEEEKPFEYEQIVISQPENEANFINNGGQFDVKVSLKPNLRKTDKIQLYLNNEAKLTPQQSTSYSFDNMDRGNYTAMVKILNASGETIGSSDPVTFYVKRPSKLN